MTDGLVVCLTRDVEVELVGDVGASGMTLSCKAKVTATDKNKDGDVGDGTDQMKSRFTPPP